MSNYFQDLYVEGVSDEEMKILSLMKSVSVMRETKLTVHLYGKFIKGEKVPPFVREKMEKFLKKFANDIEEIYKDKY